MRLNKYISSLNIASRREADKLMRAYDARDAFLLGQKMMLSREREEGIKEGIEKRNYTIAKSMKKENIDIETIKRITGLTIKEIEKL